MRALADVLVPWHEFVTLLRTAAGTLVALLFVAATLASGVFFSDRRAPLRLFLSASVVHFSSVLVVSLILLAPVENWVLLGAMVVVCGLVGLAYYGVAWRDAMRDGVAAAIDLEDRLWYAVLPVVIYLCETASGVMLGLAAGGRMRGARRIAGRIAVGRYPQRVGHHHLDHHAPAGVGGVRLISMERARYAPPQHAEETR